VLIQVRTWIYDLRSHYTSINISQMGPLGRYTIYCDSTEGGTALFSNNAAASYPTRQQHWRSSSSLIKSCLIHAVLQCVFTSKAKRCEVIKVFT